MTVNTTFATMISRNLNHFERLLQAEQKQNSGQFANQLNGLYRSIDYGAQLPESNRQAAILFVESWAYIEQHSDYRQWSKLAVRIANRFTDTNSGVDTFLLCRVITLLGTLLQATGDNVKAEQIFRSAERLALAKENTGAIVNAWYYLASYCYRVDQYVEAQQYLDKTITLIKKELDLSNHDYRRLYGFTLNLQGLIHRTQQDYTTAQQFLEQADEVLSTLEVGHYQLITLINLASLYNVIGEFERSCLSYEKGIAYAHKYGLTLWHTQAVFGYSRSLVKQGQVDQAFVILSQIDHVDLLRMGNLDLMVAIKIELAKQLIMRKQPQCAKPYLEEILTLASVQDNQLNYAIVTGLWGLTCGSEEKHKTTQLLQKALIIFDTQPELSSFFAEYQAMFQTILTDIMTGQILPP